jgi:hypothetical protein
VCRPMCAGLDAGRNGVIRNGLKVFGSGELVWKTDVFGVLGEFRSEFRSASAPLAQLVEQRTFNPQVLGSSPRGRTIWTLFSLLRLGLHRGLIPAK